MSCLLLVSRIVTCGPCIEVTKLHTFRSHDGIDVFCTILCVSIAGVSEISSKDGMVARQYILVSHFKEFSCLEGSDEKHWMY